MTNRLSTTSSNATVEEDDTIGGIVFQAKEITERVPAAFTSGTAELESEECRFRDLTDSVRAAGNFGVIEQQYAHNFAETEGNDRQIVAAQAKHREAEQEAGRRCH